MPGAQWLQPSPPSGGSAGSSTVRSPSWTTGGVNITLLHKAPGLIKVILKQGVTRWLQRRAARREGFADVREVWPGPAKQVVDPKSSAFGGCPKLKGLAAAIAAGAIKCRIFFEDNGYEVDNVTCPACGAARDTLIHRVLFCNAAPLLEARSAAAPQWLMDEKGHG